MNGHSPSGTPTTFRAAVYSADGRSKAWEQALQAHVPDLETEIWPEIAHPEAMDIAVVWRPPVGMMAALKRLRAVFSLGAGVDHIMALPDLPAQVPVIRLEDAGMAEQMIEYVLYGVLHYHRDFDHYQADRNAGVWQPRPVRRRNQTRIGVLGLGALGTAVAYALRDLGFTVIGWSRILRTLDGIETDAGPESLRAVAGRSDILVVMLPLTDSTRGLLNQQLFDCMPGGSALINCARGELVAEDDLLAALDSGRLRGAFLDVASQEPPPPTHAFWSHPRIELTPHIAAATRMEEACVQIAENLARLKSGRPLLHQIQLARGY